MNSSCRWRTRRRERERGPAAKEKEKEEVPVRTWEERKRREKELCTEMLMLPEAVEHALRFKHHHLDYKYSVGILDPTF